MRTALYLTPLLIWLAACGTDADGDGVISPEVTVYGCRHAS